VNLGEIEERVAELDTGQRFDFIYDLLWAYGLPKASISRLRNGSHNRSDREDERLWKGKVYYRFVQGDDDLHVLIDTAKSDPRIVKERPRFLIVRDAKHLLALDMKTGATLDTPMSELSSHTTFFLPWAGIEKTQVESLNYADIKAAEKMARLYDEIIRHNEISTTSAVHALNLFFSRLLFCFFAEDTGVFVKDQFTNAVGSFTAADGGDVHLFLDKLFGVLNMEPKMRSGLPSHLRDFGYVNGNLFNQESASPVFSAKARRLVLECATLDWSQINPDIFGSMIQAVVHPSQREGLGMHYTSVENIMKVIRPLFLDDLHAVFDAGADSPGKLQSLLDRICQIKLFDPACGSGNFLVIGYKELRRLEHRILQRISELDPNKAGLFKLSGLKLENFYGIEIDDFAHEIAILSLWLAKHQMNVEFKELFGVEISLIPLKDTGNVLCGNATRVDWNVVCPASSKGEVYVLGNPPYLGAVVQTPENKADVAAAFGGRPFDKNVDYVSAWFVKGADFVARNKCDLGFVSTNSICQGAHVGMLWPHIYSQGVNIAFAHTSFPWSNSARGKAGVTCVIIGLSAAPKRRFLFGSGTRREVENINAYLVGTHRKTIVEEARRNLSGLPHMVFGTRLVDGGNLILGPGERLRLLNQHPGAEKYLKRFIGASEFLNGQERWCLYIHDADAAGASEIDEIAERLRRVAEKRRKSPERKTRELAAFPHRLYSPSYKESPSIIVPGVSSERREYIPMGFLDRNTVISNLAYAIYDAEPWVFGLIQSRMHMVWVRAVAGRLKSDYRYSAVLVYNTFPVPDLTDSTRAQLTKHVYEVLDAREQFADKTLAELYDPDKMPDVLRLAHRRLDQTADRLYRDREFASDEERLELLFQMYEDLVAAKDGALTHA